MNGIFGCLDIVDVYNSILKIKTKVEIVVLFFVWLLESEEIRGLEYKVEEKGIGCSDVAFNVKGKVRVFVFFIKRNKNVVEGVRR